ncbi:50S ribosomal protein P1 [Candidatus Woesearchaeota archaeon]|nr:50S ribosomal protein P1 [Candidatus Woesearchaeota archaeon]MBI2661299.1 50S ribosomal protein P1 [Candidatus Woesearchaeota archaeon]
MEYVYSAMLLHKAGKPVSEQNMHKVLEAAGIKADDARIKALIAALEGVNIEEAIEKASVAMAAPAAAPAAHSAPAADRKHEEKKKEEDSKKSEESAAAGLGALFG